MPTLILIDRERGLTRDRPRLNWPGNYVTFRRYNKVYYLLYSRVDSNYVKWWPYRHPYSHPHGYVFAPVLEPRPTPLQPTTSPEAVYQPPGLPEPATPVSPGAPAPPYIPATPPIVIEMPPAPGPPQLPTIPTIPLPQPPTTFPAPPGTTGPTKVIPIPAADFVGDWLNVTTAEIRPYNYSIPIRAIAIFAHPNNTDDILIYSVKSGKSGFRLPPGGGIVLEIDDVSKIKLRAISGMQMVSIAYELAKYSMA